MKFTKPTRKDRVIAIRVTSQLFNNLKHLSKKNKLSISKVAEQMLLHCLNKSVDK